MITKEQALTASEFHYRECVRNIGPKGGVYLTQTRARRNGKTQTWKTRPNDFRIPVKYGLSRHYQITEAEADQWHTAEECAQYTITREQG